MSAHTPSSNSAPYKLLKLYGDADSITTTIDFVLDCTLAYNIEYTKLRQSLLDNVGSFFVHKNQTIRRVIDRWQGKYSFVDEHRSHDLFKDHL